MIKGQRIPDSFKPQEQNIDSKAWHVEVNRHESTYHHEYLHPLHADDETTVSVGALILGAAEKTTPVDADMMPVMDTADSNKVRKLSWANIKATLKAYFDSIYAPIATATFPGFGTTGTTACVGNDSRLSDSRPPATHSHPTSDITSFAAAALSAAPAETATTIGTLINGATAITAPDDTDTIAMRNHAGGLLHKITWAYVKSVLKTYFDTLYQSAGTYLISGGALGTPSSGNLANCAFPTLNQNTTGIASGIDGWTTATLLNSWVQLAAGYAPKYRKSPTGLVTIAGCVKSGTTNIVFQLPAGYRPPVNRQWMSNSSAGPSYVYVDSSGNVNVGNTGTSYQYLDVSFYAE